MDWTQTITLGATLIAYMTGMCIFFYRLNEKTIKEWREEHAKQLTESENRHKEDVKTIREEMNGRWEKSDNYWRELFTYMNNKIDEVKKPS